MDDHVWHVVKSTPRVTGFVGTGQQPTPLSEEEVQHIVYKVADSREKPKLKVKFEKNENGAHLGRPVCNVYGRGGRSQRRPRDVEGDGDDLRPLDSGGTGVRTGGEGGVRAVDELREARSASRDKFLIVESKILGSGLGREREYGKKGYRFGQAADCGGEGHAGASGWSGAGPGPGQHHGVLQAVQCPHAGRRNSKD